MPLFPSYRNQSIDLHNKSIGWFLYEGNTGTKWVNLVRRIKMKCVSFKRVRISLSPKLRTKHFLQCFRHIVQCIIFSFCSGILSPWILKRHAYLSIKLSKTRYQFSHQVDHKLNVEFHCKLMKRNFIWLGNLFCKD